MNYTGIKGSPHPTDHSDVIGHLVSFGGDSSRARRRHAGQSTVWHCITPNGKVNVHVHAASETYSKIKITCSMENQNIIKKLL